MHFEYYIFVNALDQLATLRVIEPDFAKLEVDITVGLRAGDKRHKLTRDDVEGSNYYLSLNLSLWESSSQRDAQ